MSQAKQMLKQSSIYAIGNIIRQLVGFIMLPVYTHYLSPADFGVVSLLIFMVSLIELLFGGHMFHAVPKFYFDEDDVAERKKVVSTALLLTALISSFSVLVVMFFSKSISLHLLGASDYSLLVAMFAVQILTNALENYGLVYIRLLKKAWMFMGFSMSKLVLQLSLNIWFVVILDKGLLGIALSSLISSSVMALILTVYTLSKVKFSLTRNIASYLIRFSWPLWISGLAGLYIGSSNRYFIRVFSSLDEVGLFELAAKFGGVVVLLFWTPFAQYWQTERFNIHKKPNAIAIFQTTFSLVSVVLVSAGLAMSLFSEEVIILMSSDEFHEAIKAIPFLVLSAVFSSLIIFNNFSFLVTEKTGWMSRNSFVTAGVISVFYLVLIPEYGFVGAAQAVALGKFIQFIIVFYAAKKQYDMQLFLSPLFLSILAAILAFYLSILFSNDDILLSILTKSAVLVGYGFFALLTLLKVPTIRAFAANYIRKD